jgi:LmbE family N-acetylglucosaminyl deacetylase
VNHPGTLRDAHSDTMISVSTILAFIPHPDDEVYSFAGTLALAARKGWRCIVHCATHGEGGERHDGLEPGPAALAETREAELIASCEILRIDPPQFWGLPDGQLHLHRGEERRIEQLIRQHRPEIVLTLGPDGAYGHPDHLAMHRWVTNAWQALSTPSPLLFAAFPGGLFLPQYEKCLASGIMGEPPLVRPSDLGSTDPHYAVDITARAQAKLAAIRAHRSQLPGGDPHALFPGSIVEELLAYERFRDARGLSHPEIEALLAEIAD